MHSEDISKTLRSSSPSMFQFLCRTEYFFGLTIKDIISCYMWRCGDFVIICIAISGFDKDSA